MTQLAMEPRNLRVDLSWLEELRQRALRCFEEKGYPDRKQEQWRFTNIGEIAKTRYLPAPRVASAGAALKRFSFDRDSFCELVFVNGQYMPSISRFGKLVAGLTISTLSQGLAGDSAEIRNHLGRLADIKVNPFVALNTASMSEGAFIHLSADICVEQAIHLLFITVPGDEAVVTHPRILIVADKKSQATIVESYVGEGNEAYFTNAVTEIFADEDCQIDHCKLQHDSAGANHISTTQVTLGRAAQFVSHSASLGGKLVRNDVNVTMVGEQAEATLNGLVLLDGDRHCDNHTLLDHAAANCQSHELFKHVLSDRSTGVFKGKILVRQDSQKTDSKQTSKTLLLSDDAIMNAMPALEIYADDVKCTHGSTLGPVDEEQVFYLRSRGINLEAARHLLTYAFAADITRRIRFAPMRARIENHIAAQHGLPLDLRITDLGAHDEAVVNA